MECAARFRDDRFSPELALVCPELRAAAIAALPDRDQDAFLIRRTTARASRPEYLLLHAIGSEAEPEPRTPLPVAILAYTAHRAALTIVEATALLSLVTGALALAAAINS
jgi:hypothetical protein